MERVSSLRRGDDEPMELPPGFRFHPTDEELITHYLSHKVLDSCFCARAIGDVDLNKVEPWDLPWRAKMGEREWYFFCVRDRKYPTGSRTNRATDSGYWKATGKDKEIYRGRILVGMKKTLVFYKGRAPKGEKTNWVMHEYRLEGKFSHHNFPQSTQNEWVICRIFQKSSGGKKTQISGLVSNLPPLMDCSASIAADDSHVTCFSDPVDDKKPKNDKVDCFSKPSLANSDVSPVSLLLPKNSVPDSLFSAQFAPNIEKWQYPDSGLMEDQFVLRFLLENDGVGMKRCSRPEFSPDTGTSTDMSSILSNYEVGRRTYDDEEDPITSAGPVDLDCLWNY